MTIVASNNITVSNVNDGTITHTAWSYSADGTDRFTTVYPNLNLLKNTKSQSYTSTGTASNNSSYIYPLDGVVADILNKQLIITYNYDITNSSGTWSGTIRPTYGLGGTDQAVSNTNLSGTHKETATFTSVSQSSYRILTSGLPAGTIVTITNLKVEFGSIATPYMPSSSEATTADWPSYIGQYSDFTSTVSTDPAKYAPWTIFKGNDGVGVISTVITYAISTSGTIAPSTGWTSSVPTLVKGQYLWTKTVWTYTDTSSKTGYSVTYISKDGNNGTDGIAGKDGVGIRTTTITYASSTSGTTAPTSGWTSTVPTVTAGNYLWTKTVWAYTDNTSETGYSVAKMGNNGATGPQGPQGLKGDPGATGIPGQAGADGKTSYLHIAYATNSAGTAGFDTSNATGKTYIGQYTDFTSADSTDPSKYTWSLIKGDKGDKGDQGIKGADGTDGTSGIIVSSVAPASPQTGQLWQDTSTTPQLVKKWTGSSWVIWEFYAQNLKADSLETVSAIIGKLTNTYTVDYGTGVHTGTVTIENGMKIVDDVGVSRTITDFTSQSSGQGMFARYLPNKINTEKYQQAWYTPFSLRFDDTVNDWHGQITAENVTLVPWTNLTYSAGYTTAENNPCQYRKIKNLDGSYTVQFRGQVAPTSGQFPIGISFPMVLPADIRPINNKFAIGIPDFISAQNVRLAALTDGRFQVYVRGNQTSYVAIDSLSYVL